MATQLHYLHTNQLSLPVQYLTQMINDILQNHANLMHKKIIFTATSLNFLLLFDFYVYTKLIILINITIVWP